LASTRTSGRFRRLWALGTRGPGTRAESLRQGQSRS